MFVATLQVLVVQGLSLKRYGVNVGSKEEEATYCKIALSFGLFCKLVNLYFFDLCSPYAKIDMLLTIKFYLI